MTKSEAESCFRWYLAKKQCRNYKRIWIGPDQARPVQASPRLPVCDPVQSDLRIRLDWTEPYPGPGSSGLMESLFQIHQPFTNPFPLPLLHIPRRTNRNRRST